MIDASCTGHKADAMTEADVLCDAFAMPLTNRAYPTGPYRFVDHEYFIITYRTAPQALARIVPAPQVATDALVKYEFINLPDSTGFGHYC
jgi:acetoacetate decarboxylase